jgi:hypothetical protein
MREMPIHKHIAQFLAGIICMAAVAQAQEPVAAKKAVFVQPIRAAQIGPGFELLRPWAPYKASLRGTTQQALAYDCFEPDGNFPGTPTDGLYGENCGMGSARYKLVDGKGNPYNNCLSADDIKKLFPGHRGDAPQRALFAWWWEAGGAGTGEHCEIAILTAEDFDDTCTGPAVSNVYLVAALDFGDLPSSEDVGYYYTDVDMSDLQFWWFMPQDGSGGFLYILAQAYDDASGQFTLATNAQPMLWGTKAQNPSQQGPTHWDDWEGYFSDGRQHHRDADLQSDECLDYGFGLCPDPLGTMVCFYSSYPGYDWYYPTIMFLTKGNLVSGDIYSLRDSDDAYLVVGAQYDPTEPAAFINTAVQVVARVRLQDYSEGVVSGEWHTNAVGAIKYRLRAKKSGGVWVTLVDNVFASGDDVVLESALPHPVSDFVIKGSYDREVWLEGRAAAPNRLAGFYKTYYDAFSWVLVP